MARSRLCLYLFDSANHSHKMAVTSRFKKIGICQLRSQFGGQSGSMRLRCAGFGAALQDSKVRGLQLQPAYARLQPKPSQQN